MCMGVRQQGMQMHEERVNRVLRLKTDEGFEVAVRYKCTHSVSEQGREFEQRIREMV